MDEKQEAVIKLGVKIEKFIREMNEEFSDFVSVGVEISNKNHGLSIFEYDTEEEIDEKIRRVIYDPTVNGVITRLSK